MAREEDGRTHGPATSLKKTREQGYNPTTLQRHDDVMASDEKAVGFSDARSETDDAFHTSEPSQTELDRAGLALHPP